MHKKEKKTATTSWKTFNQSIAKDTSFVYNRMDKLSFTTE